MISGLPDFFVYFGISLVFTIYLYVLSIHQTREFRRAGEDLYEITPTNRASAMGTQVDSTWSLQTEGEQDPKISRPSAA